MILNLSIVVILTSKLEPQLLKTTALNDFDLCYLQVAQGLG
jgi:hypothetical protein